MTDAKKENPSIVAFDTETTGLPNWKVPSDDESQPHLVQLGAVRADIITHEVLEKLDVIIKPEGWVIPEETIEVHGITQDKANEVGIPEKDAVLMLWDMCARAEFKRAAHNRTFDQRLIRIALKRYFTEEMQEVWADKDDFTCTMWGSKNIVKARGKNNRIKTPSLEECYQFFFNKELPQAHDGLADAEHCLEVYWALKTWELEHA